MAQKLKEILSNTSQEDFDREWAEIEKLGFHGPHADDIVEFFATTQQATVSYELQSNDQVSISLSNNSFYTAA